MAQALNLSRAEVHRVVTFYHDFRRTPPGRHVLKLCRAEACQAMGSDDLAAHAERQLGVKLGETTPDGRATVEAIYCLGLCASMLDGNVVGRLDAADSVGYLRADGRNNTQIYLITLHAFQGLLGRCT